MGTRVSVTTVVVVVQKPSAPPQNEGGGVVFNDLQNQERLNISAVEGMTWPQLGLKGLILSDNVYAVKVDKDFTVPNVTVTITALGGALSQDANAVTQLATNLVTNSQVESPVSTGFEYIITGSDGKSVFFFRVFHNSGYILAYEARIKISTVTSMIENKHSLPLTSGNDHTIVTGFTVEKDLHEIWAHHPVVVHRIDPSVTGTCKNIDVSVLVLKLQGSVCLIPPTCDINISAFGINIGRIQGDLMKGASVNIDLLLVKGNLTLRLVNTCVHISGSLHAFGKDYKFDQNVVCF